LFRAGFSTDSVLSYDESDTTLFREGLTTDDSSSFFIESTDLTLPQTSRTLQIFMKSDERLDLEAELAFTFTVYFVSCECLNPVLPEIDTIQIGPGETFQSSLYDGV